MNKNSKSLKFLLFLLPFLLSSIISSCKVVEVMDDIGTTDEVFFKPLGSYSDYFDDSIYAGLPFPFPQDEISSDIRSTLKKIPSLKIKDVSSRIFFSKQKDGRYNIGVVEYASIEHNDKSLPHGRILVFSIEIPDATISYIGKAEGIEYFNISFNKAKVFSAFSYSDTPEIIRNFIVEKRIKCSEITNGDPEYIEKRLQGLSDITDQLIQRKKPDLYMNIIIGIANNALFVVSSDTPNSRSPREYKQFVKSNLTRFPQKSHYIGRRLSSFLGINNFLGSVTLLGSAINIVQLLTCYYACY